MESENNLKGKKVETYADDMAKAISGGQGGLIKKIIHEEEEKEALKKNISPESKKNKLFMVISVILIICATSLFIYLFISKKNRETVSIAPQFIPLIFTDKTDFQAVDGLTKEKIAASVFIKVKNTKVKTGGIEGIYFTENKKVMGFKKFASILKDDLILAKISLFNDNFLLGVANKTAAPAGDNISSTNKAPFILLKTKSFADIFPVMHDWENKMLYDLHGFFGIDISSTTNYLFTKDFGDGIVQNKNARILRDENNKIVLMYVFLNDSTLVITDSEAATGEIILRLFGSQIKK